MIVSEDLAHLSRVRQSTLDALRTHLGAVTDIALIDAPNQRNIGDSLIWAGEIAYFERLGLTIRYISDLWSYDAEALRRAMPNGVVLMHGGGNFGDLWPGHQILRERVARELTDYKVIQLPQSIYFGAESRAEEANAAIGGHPDFHVLVRDSLSMQRAAAQLPDVAVSFCPDMALGWDAPATTRATGDRVVVIARADKEATSNLVSVAEGWLPGARVEVTDWVELMGGSRAWSFYRSASKLNHLYTRGQRRLPLLPVVLPNRLARTVISSINSVNIAAAVKLYETASVVVTDRLHAHVLASLMGIPNVVLDNNYKKVSQIMHDYSGAFSTASLVSGLDEARTQVAAAVA
ncbi:pyruvyl transferase EpsO [Microbacterium sp. BE35]|uniref:polysaccharide pyruvyl transferase family protein n=1 Tax=Microbacterium sp. BE35 TaxID=2817773 RepID=UPI00285BF3BA|nr:polysaccharide pyruvyl transferase family protein [Microbacterium sp. BE35]MDR7188708.1 pyruvyl transferase EpsO [Microbacterium sp. BE35]